MLKILYISHLHPPDDGHLENLGGMQRVSMQLVAELQKRDDVEIMPITLEAKWKFIGIKTTGFLLKLVKSLPEIAEIFKADVILFSSMVTASLAPFIRKRVQVPMVTINHGQDVTLPNYVYQKFVKRIFNALDGVISVSTATKEASIERGLKAEKGYVLPNGFDESWLTSLPDKATSTSYLHRYLGELPSEVSILLSVGRQVKRKGHEWFISNVFSRLKSNVVYVLIGDGPEHQALNATVERLGLQKKIFVLGRLSDEVIHHAYAGADLFIMPNIPVKGDMEGFGIVMLEAALGGTPTIASDLEGIRDVIENGKNGYRIPSQEETKFAEVIDDVLSNQLEFLSKSTKEYVLNQFSWKHVAERYVQYLTSISNDHSSVLKSTNVA